MRAVSLSMTFSLIDVFFYGLMVSLGESLFGAYAISMGKSEIVTGLLGGIPLCFAGILQYLLCKKIPYMKTY